MSLLRVLICCVDDADEQMTELASVDPAAVLGCWVAAPLEAIDANVVGAGQDIVARRRAFHERHYSHT